MRLGLIRSSILGDDHPVYFDTIIQTVDVASASTIEMSGKGMLRSNFILAFAVLAVVIVIHIITLEVLQKGQRDFQLRESLCFQAKKNLKNYEDNNWIKKALNKAFVSIGLSPPLEYDPPSTEECSRPLNNFGRVWMAFQSYTVRGGVLDRVTRNIDAPFLYKEKMLVMCMFILCIVGYVILVVYKMVTQEVHQVATTPKMQEESVQNTQQVTAEQQSVLNSTMDEQPNTAEQSKIEEFYEADQPTVLDSEKSEQLTVPDLEKAHQPMYVDLKTEQPKDLDIEKAEQPSPQKNKKAKKPKKKKAKKTPLKDTEQAQQPSAKDTEQAQQPAVQKLSVDDLCLKLQSIRKDRQELSDKILEKKRLLMAKGTEKTATEVDVSEVEDVAFDRLKELPMKHEVPVQECVVEKMTPRQKNEMLLVEAKILKQNDPFVVLGLKRKPKVADIEEAYRRRIKRWIQTYGSFKCSPRLLTHYQEVREALTVQVTMSKKKLAKMEIRSQFNKATNKRELQR